MADVGALLADLAAESDVLDALVRDGDDALWRLATPAPGWTIADQIAHLGWTDEVALLAATDGEAFAAAVAAFADSPAAPVDGAAASAAARPPAELLAWWRRPVPSGCRPRRRRARDEAAMVRSADERGVDGARLMETWAHGQDVADALRGPPTDRSAAPRRPHRRAHDRLPRQRLMPPLQEFRVEFVGRRRPGDLGRSRPPAVRRAGARLPVAVTQRRHGDDAAVSADEADAEQWLTIAQAFAGP